MKRFTPAPGGRCRASVSTRGLLLAACLLLPTAAASTPPKIDESFYEIDGDYGSRIADTVAAPNSTPPYEPAPEISDGGITTWGVRQNCGPWAHIANAPYMGSQAYTVACLAETEATRRSEQHFVQGWRPGSDSQRSVSMAIRLSRVPAVPPTDGGSWIAQLHGEGLPFNLTWVAHSVAKPDEGILKPGYYLYAGARYTEEQASGHNYKLVGQLTPAPGLA
jgi:hypothetical protein